MKWWLGFQVSSLGRGEVADFFLGEDEEEGTLGSQQLECKLLGGGVILMLPLGQAPPHEATWTPKSQ